MLAICRGLVLAGVVVENKESLNKPNNNPNKSGAVTLSEIFSRILTLFCRKIMGLASDCIGGDRRRYSIQFNSIQFNSIKVLFGHVSQPAAELHMITEIKDTMMINNSYKTTRTMKLLQNTLY